MSTADRMWLVVVLLCVAAAALFLTMVFIGADLIAPLTGARPWPVWTRRGALTTVVATGAVLASLWLAWRGVQPTSRSVGTLLKTTLWEDTPRTASPVSVFEDTPPPALDEPASAPLVMEPQAPPAPPPDDARSSWLTLAQGCVGLLDELDRYRPFFEPDKRELASSFSLQLQAILARSGVTLVVDDQTFDARRHETETVGRPIPAGTPIVETVRPGFVAGTHVLRRARVRLRSS